MTAEQKLIDNLVKQRRNDPLLGGCGVVPRGDALHTAGAVVEQKALTAAGDVPHPAEFIREEMDARDWGIPSMARAMGGDYGGNVLALGMYLYIGPNEPMLRLGCMAADFSRALCVSVEFIENMEKAWIASQRSTPHG